VETIGQAELESGTATTRATGYLWFSMTKVVTATAVMRLVDHGKLGLDVPVADLYEPFRGLRPTERAARVTVRHLLSHSSGLANPIPLRWVHPAEHPAPDPEQFLVRLLHEHGRLGFDPGSRASHSNVGYLVLGQLITHLAGQPFIEYVREKILQPLEMTNTGFSYLEQSPYAVGYHRRRSLLTPLLPRLLPPGILGPRIGGYVSFCRFTVDGAAYGGLLVRSPTPPGSFACIFRTENLMAFASSPQNPPDR
jgi:CubicO group peptidase (beta-lactamase class C family)